MQKKWWTSKAVWGGILLVITALCKAGSEFVSTGVVDWLGLAHGASEGLGVLGIRVALK